MIEMTRVSCSDMIPGSVQLSLPNYLENVCHM